MKSQKNINGGCSKINETIDEESLDLELKENPNKAEV